MSNHNSGLNRRRFLQFLGAAPVVSQILACSPSTDPSPSESNFRSLDSEPRGPSVPPALELTNTRAFKNGYLTILQGPTSDTESLINIFSPKLKNYSYEIVDSLGTKISVAPETRVKTPTFYCIDKLHFKNLRLGETYTLNVFDKTTRIDQRNFKTLDIHKTKVRFAQLSCMADDYRFNDAIDLMWDRLQKSQVDFIVMTGDQVYVDSKEFVERQKATELDIWQRYVDALKRLPIYHWQHLVPIIAVWDDHDYGTNDGDSQFVGKEPSTRVFDAVFGGTEIPLVWEKCPAGTSSRFSAFGQRFFLMDDRSFRKTNTDPAAKTDKFGHWGEVAHQWLIEDLQKQIKPSWIFNGNQFLSGKTLEYKEAFQDNHPAEFNKLLTELTEQRSAFVLGSGDIHLSEIMIAPKDILGFQTYEYTASCMHSYTGTGWENPLRFPDATTNEFNFFVHQVQAGPNQLDITTECLGLATIPYFTKRLLVSR